MFARGQLIIITEGADHGDGVQLLAFYHIDCGLGPVAVVVVFGVGVFVVGLDGGSAAKVLLPVGEPRLGSVATLVIADVEIEIASFAGAGTIQPAVGIVAVTLHPAGDGLEDWTSQRVVAVDGAVAPRIYLHQRTAVVVAGDEVVRHAVAVLGLVDKVFREAGETAKAVVEIHHAVHTAAVGRHEKEQFPVRAISITLVGLALHGGSGHGGAHSGLVVGLGGGDEQFVLGIHAKIGALHGLHPSPIAHLASAVKMGEFTLPLRDNRQQQQANRNGTFYFHI